MQSSLLCHLVYLAKHGKLYLKVVSYTSFEQVSYTFETSQVPRLMSNLQYIFSNVVVNYCLYFKLQIYRGTNIFFVLRASIALNPDLCITYMITYKIKRTTNFSVLRYYDSPCYWYEAT